MASMISSEADDMVLMWPFALAALQHQRAPGEAAGEQRHQGRSLHDRRTGDVRQPLAERPLPRVALQVPDVWNRCQQPAASLRESRGGKTGQCVVKPGGYHVEEHLPMEGPLPQLRNKPG